MDDFDAALREFDQAIASPPKRPSAPSQSKPQAGTPAPKKPQPSASPKGQAGGGSGGVLSRILTGASEGAIATVGAPVDLVNWGLKKVGLGSDISGGPAGTVWENARQAVTMSRMLESGVDPSLPPDARGGQAGARVDAVTAFRLATRGGAEALGLPVGAFREGMAFDAMLVDPSVEAGTLRVFDEDVEGARLLERVLYGTSKPNITSVWVNGEAVVG